MASVVARVVMVVLLVAPVLAGCLGSDPVPEEPAEGAEAPFIPRVVLAVIDTGLMPYHTEWLQIREGEDGEAHPAMYLPGYPEDAVALPLTLDLSEAGAETDRDDEEEKVKALFEQDEALWSEVERETLYWIPGSKVVGFIGFGADLPGGGHGSMVSSRSAGNTISIPGAEVLLVNVRVPLAIDVAGAPEEQAVRWVADQPWIDIQSNSWGMPAMCVGPLINPFTGWMDAFRYARDKQLVLSATHNGHGNSGTLGYPSQCQDTAGPAGVVPVGAVDNGALVSWSNWFPAVAADGCRNPAIRESSTNLISNTGGGTSSATPFTAGGAASTILEARRIFHDSGVGVHDGVVATLHEGGVLPETGPLSDGIFTLDELKAVLFRTARPVPQVDPSDGDPCGVQNRIPVPPGADASTLYPFIGYGEVNHDSIALALEVLRGETALPERSDEDRFYEQDQELRRTLWG
jgi:hypothetical protein